MASFKDLVLTLAPLALTAACDSRTPAADVGAHVFTDEVEELALSDLGGGLEPERPPGACDPAIATYTLTVADRNLHWDMCVSTTNGTAPSYDRLVGARALTLDEWATLRPTLERMVVVAGAGCGADKDELALRVTTAAGTESYGDAFYACRIHDRALVDADTLDASASALRMLALLTNVGEQPDR